MKNVTVIAHPLVQQGAVAGDQPVAGSVLVFGQLAGLLVHREGSVGFYGVADRSVKGLMLGADRWARSIAWIVSTRRG